MPHDFTEDQLIEQHALGLLAELRWEIVPQDTTLGHFYTLGFHPLTEMILLPRPCAAFRRHERI